MRTILSILTAAIAAGYLLFCSCGLTSLTGGTSTAENGMVIGKIVDSNGTPAPRVEVKLFPINYNPMTNTDTVPSDTTDVLGNYAFGAVGPGYYNIQSVHLDRRTRALESGIFVARDTASVVADTLDRPGALKIMLQVSAAGAYVYLPGTSFRAPLHSDTALIDSVPAGFIPALYYADPADTTKNRVLRTSFSIPSGVTTVIADFATWKYQKKLYLNTTASGADVAGNVTAFPVLVRLTSANFPFDQAQAGGADVRFAKADGPPLPYEIERWDAAARQAAVWVMVDTVFGNNNTRYIVLKWGNPEASGASNSGLTFDSAAGFKAVWHLSGQCRDATAGGRHASVCTPADTSGIIGNGKRFGGGDSIMVPGLLDMPSNITLSGWVQCLPTDSGGEILSLGDAALVRVDDSRFNNSFGTMGSFHTDSVLTTYRWQEYSTGRFLRNTGWHHVAFSIDAVSHSQALYIDAKLSYLSHFAGGIDYSGVGKNTLIGKHGNGSPIGYYFKGIMDEVRVSKVARSADWIKLEYMNQNTIDKLIEMK